MPNTFSLKDQLAAIKSAAEEASTAVNDGFQARVLAYRRGGLAFKAIVDHEVKSTKDGAKPPTKNAVFRKHEAAIKKNGGLSRTCLVDECYTFAMWSEAKVVSALNAYLKVGIGEQSFDANGNVRLRTDYLAQAIVAEQEVEDPKSRRKNSRWNKNSGTLVKKSNNAKKPKAEQIKDLNKQINENPWNDEWSVELLTAAELKDLMSYLRLVERKLTLAG